MGNSLIIYMVKDLDGNEIMTGTAKEIGEELGETSKTVSSYAVANRVLHDKYTIEKIGLSPYARNKDIARIYQLFNNKMLKEWRYMNEHYGTVGKKIYYPFTEKTYREWMKINRIFSRK